VYSTHTLLDGSIPYPANIGEEHNPVARRREQLFDPEEKKEETTDPEDDLGEWGDDIITKVEEIQTMEELVFGSK